MRITVVGGGITGLAAAHTLVRAGADVVLVEASDRLGGKIRTDRVAGALIEAGPDWFLTRQPAALSLCESLGLADDLVAPAVSGVKIWSRGDLHPLHPGFVRGVPASVPALLSCRLLSARGRVRALGDLGLAGRVAGPDVSVGSVIRRRFGSELLERLVDPMLAASRSGSPDEMSLAAAAPEIDAAARSSRSIIRGLARSKPHSVRVFNRLAGKSALKVQKGPEFVGLRGGMGRLVEALVAELDGAEVRLGAEAAELRAGAGGFTIAPTEGPEIKADGVVLAVPAFAAARLVAGLSPEAAHILETIRYEPGTVAGLVYPPGAVEPPQESGGWLVPSSEGGLLRAGAWYSTKWPHSAPDDGGAVLRCFVGAGAARHSDAELVGAIRAEIAQIIGISARPTATHIVRWDRALPVFEVGHLDRITAVERALEPWPGLALAGAGYRGSGLPDCISAGQEAARKVQAGR